MYILFPFHTNTPNIQHNSFIYFNIFSIDSNVCMEKKKLQQRGWWINNRWTKKEGKNITLVYHFILSPAVCEFISFMFASLFQDRAISIYYYMKGEKKKHRTKFDEMTEKRLDAMSNEQLNKQWKIPQYAFVCVRACVCRFRSNMWKMNLLDGKWLK